MKKIVCIIAVVLMVASVVYAQTKAAKGITAQDLPAMKGTWRGMLSYGTVTDMGNSPAKLEILNDSVPLKSKLTVENPPAAATQALGLQSGTNTFETDGVITSHGTLLFADPKGTGVGFFEVTKSGDNKITIFWWYSWLKGTGSFTKK